MQKIMFSGSIRPFRECFVLSITSFFRSKIVVDDVTSIFMAGCSTRAVLGCLKSSSDSSSSA